MDKRFIDGNNLKNDIISYMPHLKTFEFNIRSAIHVETATNVSSIEYIRNTFNDFTDYKIISYIDHFPDEKCSECHMYSYPNTMSHLRRLTNNFPGELFQYIREVLLEDQYPFEHEFFIRISQSFPLLKILSIENCSPQNRKQLQQSNENNQYLPVIQYPHLTHLYFLSVHSDYIEQFLFDTKTHLSNYIQLYINYRSLQKVTNNFTRNETKINCAKVRHLINTDTSNIPEDFHEYFPNLDKL